MIRRHPPEVRPQSFPRHGLPSSLLPLVLLAAGCATLGGAPGEPLLPTRHEVHTGPFVVHSPVPIGTDSAVIRSLKTLERDLTSNLGLRAEGLRPPVEVYVLRDRDSFTRFLTFHHPELPPRRAFFLARGSQRLVYTFFNDRLEEDLRHEATHAVLHATVGGLPLWLDEGLAEYFEVPRAPLGLNNEHVARLPDDLKAGWRPDLTRLESLGTVRDMSPRDYREAWAWVHFLLNDPSVGRSTILAYLADLREHPDTTPPLSTRLTRLEGGSGTRLLAYLSQMKTGPVEKRPPPLAKARRVDEPIVLLQDAPLATATGVEPQPRRGVLGRLLGLFRGPGTDPVAARPPR